MFGASASGADGIAEGGSSAAPVATQGVSEGSAYGVAGTAGMVIPSSVPAIVHGDKGDTGGAGEGVPASSSISDDAALRPVAQDDAGVGGAPGAEGLSGLGDDTYGYGAPMDPEMGPAGDDVHEEGGREIVSEGGGGLGGGEGGGGGGGVGGGGGGEPAQYVAPEGEQIVISNEAAMSLALDLNMDESLFGNDEGKDALF